MSRPTPLPAWPQSIDWRWALPRILVVFLVTRLLLVAVAVAVETTQPAPPEGVAIDDRPVLTSLTVWDARYYTSISDLGYHADPDYGPDYAFYPGYPIVVRAASLLTLGDTNLAAVAVANLAFLLALVALYALSRRYLDRERALRSQWFFALAPGAAAFGLAYSDSVFVLLLLAAFLAMEERRVWIAGIALALATLVRVPGILFGLPLLMMLTAEEGYRPSRRWLPLLLAPAVLVAFYGYLWWLTGDFFAAAAAQSYWNPDPVLDEAGAPTGALDFTTSHGDESFSLAWAPEWIYAIWIGILAVYVFLFVYFRHDRIPLPYLTMAVMTVATIFISAGLQSSTRYLAVAWPFAWVLANRRSRFGRSAALVVFAVGQVVLLWLAFTWRLAP